MLGDDGSSSRLTTRGGSSLTHVGLRRLVSDNKFQRPPKNILMVQHLRTSIANAK
jgi:hypothetical protein